MSEITITQADNGRTVEARQGDTITVRLDENPTTGYSWAVDSADPAALALQDTDYAAAPNSGDIVGGGGERQLRFKAIGPGTAELRLKHWREWEGDTSIVERFNVTVQVR